MMNYQWGERAEMRSTVRYPREKSEYSLAFSITECLWFLKSGQDILDKKTPYHYSEGDALQQLIGETLTQLLMTVSLQKYCHMH